MTNSIIYIIYETKCIVNNKIYVGVHRCTIGNIQDGYLGSGNNLKKAIKKHGYANFIRRVLYVFTNEKPAYLKEAEIVNEDFVNRANTYNMKIGGIGGGIAPNEIQLLKRKQTTLEKYGVEHTSQVPSINERQSVSRKQTMLVRYGYTNNLQTPASIIKRKEIMMERYGEENPGRVSELTEKRKAAFKQINHQQGSKNSQYGSMWITNGNVNKKILKGTTLPDGFKPGRVVLLVAPMGAEPISPT